MNGKGSKPRNCFSRQFKDNYDGINWGSEQTVIDNLTFSIYREKWGWIVKSLDGTICAQGWTKNGAIKSLKRVLSTYEHVIKKIAEHS